MKDKTFQGILADIKSTKTTDLIVNHRSFTNEQIDELIDVLKKNIHIKVIWLFHCAIGDYGAYRMAEWLLENGELQVLTLEHAEIFSVAASALLQAATKHPKLNQLNLRGNHIDDTNVGHICELITTTEDLKVLNLAENDLSKLGIQEIANCLKNTNLAAVDLRANDVNSGTFVKTIEAQVAAFKQVDLNISRSFRKKEKIEDVVYTLATCGLWGPVPIYKGVNQIVKEIKYKNNKRPVPSTQIALKKESSDMLVSNKQSKETIWHKASSQLFHIVTNLSSQHIRIQSDPELSRSPSENRLK